MYFIVCCGFLLYNCCMEKFISKNSDDTFDFGVQLASLLQKGDIVKLSGELGAGKTQLVKGIAFGFGVRDTVLSPTFCIHQILNGEVAINHFDFYRVDAVEIEAMGLNEYFFESDSLCIIEWWQNAESLLPKTKKTGRIVEIEIAKTSENEREIKVKF